MIEVIIPPCTLEFENDQHKLSPTIAILILTYTPVDIRYGTAAVQ